MKVWVSILGTLSGFALAGCDSDTPVTKPGPLSISVAHENRVGFDQLIASMGQLAQKTQVVFSHPRLPSPIFIASGELANRWAGGGCPVALLIEKTGLRYDGLEITHSDLAVRLSDYAELARGTGGVASIVVVSASAIPFADGIEVFRTLVLSGIDHVVVPTPGEPSDPSQQRIRVKPHPPSTR